MEPQTLGSIMSRPLPALVPGDFRSVPENTGSRSRVDTHYAAPPSSPMTATPNPNGSSSGLLNSMLASPSSKPPTIGSGKSYNQSHATLQDPKSSSYTEDQSDHRSIAASVQLTDQLLPGPGASLYNSTANYSMSQFNFPKLSGVAGYRHGTMQSPSLSPLTTPLYTPLKHITAWKGFAEFVREQLISCERYEEYQQRQVVPQDEYVNKSSVRQMLLACVINPVVEALCLPDIEITFAGDGVDSVVILDPDCALTYRKQAVWCCITILDDPDDALTNDFSHGSGLLLMQRMYGLMVLNNCLYGVVTGYERTWVLKRCGRALLVSPPVGRSNAGFDSPVAAFLAVVLSCRKEEQKLGDVHNRLTESIRITGEDYIRLIPCTSSSYALYNGNLVAGLYNGHRALIKITEYHCAALEHEYRVYSQNLASAQADGVVPKVIAAGNCWNLGKVLVMEDCGRRLTVDELSPNVWAIMKEAVVKIHLCNVVHTNLRLSHFVWYGDGALRLANFERAIVNPSPTEKCRELERLNALWAERRDEDWYWLLWY